MASTNSIAVANVAGLITGATPRNVQKDFERLNFAKAPLVGYFGYGKAQKLGESSKLEWVKDKSLQRTITNTANIVTADTSITVSTSDGAAIQKGQVLLVDNELVLVATVASSTTIGVTKGFASTTSTTHTTSSVIQVLAPAMADGALFTQSATIRGETEYNYAQLIPYEYEETGFRAGHQGSYLTKGMDELDYAVNVDHKMNVTVQLERSLLHSQRSLMSASNPGSFHGLRAYIATNVTSSVGLLTATVIEDLLDLMFAWDGDLECTLIGNRKMHRIFSAVMNQFFNRNGDINTTEVGVAIDSYRSSLGTIHYMDVDSMLDGELLFVKKSDISIIPIDLGPFGSGWQSFERGPEQTNAVSRQKGFYGCFTLKVGDERRHGKLTGITSTVGSYAGAV